MTARFEFLLGMVALVITGLVMTALYLRAEVRKEQVQHDDQRSIGLPSL